MLFFFYGTLTESGRLRAVVGNAPFRIVGGGVVTGTLYDLGDYPGLVLDGAARVQGVLVEMDDTAASRLDDYEGVGDGLYARRLVSVEQTRAPGATVGAWTYEYLGEVGAKAPIARWSGYTADSQGRLT